MGMADACACDRLAEDKLLLNTQKLYFRTPIFATFASMKPTKFFACLFAAWFTLCLCCCDDKPSYNARLTAIDSVADTDAPRALAMLDSLKPHIAGAAEADRNLYSLMRVKAEDKAFVTHKTDTLMLRLIHRLLLRRPCVQRHERRQTCPAILPKGCGNDRQQFRIVWCGIFTDWIFISLSRNLR